MPGSTLTSDPTGPEAASTHITVEQRVGAAAAGSQIIGASIGQATAQRDLIIQTFQTIHERKMTAVEGPNGAAKLAALSARSGRRRRDLGQNHQLS